MNSEGHSAKNSSSARRFKITARDHLTDKDGRIHRRPTQNDAVHSLIIQGYYLYYGSAINTVGNVLH